MHQHHYVSPDIIALYALPQARTGIVMIIMGIEIIMPIIVAAGMVSMKWSTDRVIVGAAGVRMIIVVHALAIVMRRLQLIGVAGFFRENKFAADLIYIKVINRHLQSSFRLEFSVRRVLVLAIGCYSGIRIYGALHDGWAIVKTIVMVAKVIVPIVMSARVITMKRSADCVIVGTTCVVVGIVMEEPIIMGRLQCGGVAGVLSDRELVADIIHIKIVNRHGESSFARTKRPKSRHGCRNAHSITAFPDITALFDTPCDGVVAIVMIIMGVKIKVPVIMAARMVIVKGSSDRIIMARRAGIIVIIVMHSQAVIMLPLLRRVGYVVSFFSDTQLVANIIHIKIINRHSAPQFDCFAKG